MPLSSTRSSEKGQEPRHRPLLDTAEAAAYLGATERWVRGAWARRELPAVKIGRLVRFDPDDLDRYIDAGRGAAVTGRLAS